MPFKVTKSFPFSPNINSSSLRIVIRITECRKHESDHKHIRHDSGELFDILSAHVNDGRHQVQSPIQGGVAHAIAEADRDPMLDISENRLQKSLEATVRQKRS